MKCCDHCQRNHLEDNDSSTIATVLDQLHEALGDLLHSEDAELLLQHAPICVIKKVVQDCGVCKSGADALNLKEEVEKQCERSSKP